MRQKRAEWGGGVFMPCTLKNGECQNEIKKNVERESRREREVGESKSRRQIEKRGGRGKPCLSLRGESKPQMSHYVAVSQTRASI